MTRQTQQTQENQETLTSQRTIYRYKLEYITDSNLSETYKIVTVESEESAHTFSILAAPSRDGYIFKGWAESANSPVRYGVESTELAKTIKITGKKNETITVKLYAVWESIPATITQQ